MFLHLYTCISSSNWAVYLLRLWGFSIYKPVFPPATGLCTCSACGVSPSIYLYFLQQLGCVPPQPEVFLHLYTCISSSNWAEYLLRLWGFSIYIPVFPPATGLCTCSACGVSSSVYLYFLQQLGCVPALPVGFLHLCTCISSSNWAVYLLSLRCFSIYIPVLPPATGLCTCSACGVSPSIYLYFLQQLGCVLAPPVGFLHLYTCISFSNWAVYLLCLWGFSIYIPVFPPVTGLCTCSA